MTTEWMTYAEATALVGCSQHTIERAVKSGQIRRRGSRDRKLPSLDRASVEEFADWRCAQQAVVERRRAAREAARKSGPPDDGEVWLDAITSSLVVGVSAQYLGRLAAQERLPAALDRGRRKWWFRRRDVEQLAAARALSYRFSAKSSPGRAEVVHQDGHSGRQTRSGVRPG